MTRYWDSWLRPLAALLLLPLGTTSVRAQVVTSANQRKPAPVAALFRGTHELETANDLEASAADADETTTHAATISDEAGERAPGAELIQERYPNRAVKTAREVTQDEHGNYVNHGSCKMWDERGNRIAEGRYENGQREGIWNRWYRNGEIEMLRKAPYSQFVGPYISQATFRNGKLEGPWVIYDSKQRKISQWNFAEGNREGKWIWWFANGQKMREVDYRGGEIDGQFIEYGRDGKVLVQQTYQQGRRLASKTEYFAGTVKKSQGVYLFAKEAVETPDDWWNGKLAVYQKQGKDEKQGAWVSWFKGGQVEMQGEYQYDVPVGWFTWWYQNGQQRLEGSFENGKQSGLWIWWHENGQKATQGEYAEGNPTGRWTWWNADGKLAQSADLSHGEGKVVETPAAQHAARRPVLRPSSKR